MSLASLVLRIDPEKRQSAEAALSALPGVECHAMSAEGKLVVTVEDAPGAAMSDTLIAIHRIPEVLAATLAFESGDAYDDAESSDSRPCEEPTP
ncbi:chaperone NapD [uncultured Propionivibrio sp.]|uniref:chaperone NapD n=1 Tax=uncultured Propionivibrio sp. TaxID=426737 RepID=UPI0029C0F4C6|nr:chaperone NapD [uncultured Propionivibrio sp.]